MLQSFLNAWRLPDLRKKLLFTAMIIAIYRLGCYIPVPGVDVQAIKALFNTGGVFDFYNLLRAAGCSGWPSSPWGSCRTSRHPSSCSS